ncbi:MAG TPA: SDR family oxidoreductase [Ilumatobacteraceae bacterium]|nr:SDR family oxidoreductase [Ilumatobacteraceae bacterium]
MSTTIGDRLLGKVALITGGAAGLGRVCAERFAAEGAMVVVADIGDGDDVVSAIDGDGGEAAFVACDVTDADAVAAAVEFAVETYGTIDVLCNFAGVMLPGDDDPVSTPIEIYRRTMDINVLGTLLFCRATIPVMLDNPTPSSIVNVASFVAHMGAATPQIAYTASKGAVLAMSREMAVIYARRGIRVNALCPGPVMTPLLAAFLDDDAKRTRRLVHVPMGRFGEPSEIANGALFLASDESSWMTGQSLIIDGGITAAYTTPEDGR